MANISASLLKLFAPFRGQYTVTQGFGPTSYTAEPAYNGYSHFHTGIDYALPLGTPVLAAGSGTVIASGWDTTGFGNRIEIDMGNGIDTLYGHLSSLGVSVGQTVTAGEQIGLSGSTGNSSGPHLHFSVLSGGQFVDPTPYLTGGAPPPSSSGSWLDQLTGIPKDIITGAGNALGNAGSTIDKTQQNADSAFTDWALSQLGIPKLSALGSSLKKWGLIILLSIGALLLVLELFRTEAH